MDIVENGRVLIKGNQNKGKIGKYHKKGKVNLSQLTQKNIRKK